MKITYRRWAIGALTAALFAVLSGCIATVGDYDRRGEGGYGVGYYEPYGDVYGGWPSGYHVGPPRGDRARETQSRPARESSRSSKPAYRPAPESRPLPTLPSKRRSHDH
jgi:hypothetical protein